MTDHNKWNEACEYTRQQDVQIKKLKIKNKTLELKIATLLAKQRELEYNIEVLDDELYAYRTIEEIENTKE